MRRYPSRMGVGASSILFILVVVSLTLFSVLSLMQARADAALTEKTAVSVNAYYDADARAQKTLALIDNALQRGGAPEIIEASVGLTYTVSDGYEYLCFLGRTLTPYEKIQLNDYLTARAQ